MAGYYSELDRPAEGPEMSDRINENVVVLAAREWAKRSSKSELTAAANVIDVMRVLKGKFSSDKYARTLEKLYCEYTER